MARYDLSLSEHEFWRSTPRMIHALFKRWEQREERQDFRAGLVASVIANANRNPKKRAKPYQPQDFMPQRKAPKPMTPAAGLALVRALNAAFGGADLRGAAA